MFLLTSWSRSSLLESTGITNARPLWPLTFPIAFSGITSVVVSNGDGVVGNLNMNVLNALRTSGFDCRVYNNGGAQTGAVRINYIATGVVNI